MAVGEKLNYYKIPTKCNILFVEKSKQEDYYRKNDKTAKSAETSVDRFWRVSCVNTEVPGKFHDSPVAYAARCAIRQEIVRCGQAQRKAE